MQYPTTIIDDVSNLTRKMRTVFDNMVRVKGLTLARARILRRLHTAGAGETQRALAEELEIEGPTLVRLLDNLEQLGCIARVAVEGDRRAKQIVLTEEGERQAEEIESVAVVFRKAILDGIDPNEIEIARKVVTQMQKNLGL
jgi:MarR family transcriptional regulator for hemolysin